MDNCTFIFQTVNNTNTIPYTFFEKILFQHQVLSPKHVVNLHQALHVVQLRRRRKKTWLIRTIPSNLLCAAVLHSSRTLHLERLVRSPVVGTPPFLCRMLWIWPRHAATLVKQALCSRMSARPQVGVRFANISVRKTSVLDNEKMKITTVSVSN